MLPIKFISFCNVYYCNVFFAGKKEIIAFKEKTGICYEWQTIRNKVVNEKMAWKKRADKRRLNLHFGNIA